MVKRVEEKKDKKGAKKDGEEKKDVVAKFRYFAKAALAPYPDEDGAPIYVGKAGDEKSFFKAGYVLKGRNKDNCELLHRIGMALCLAAASFDHGAKAIVKRVPLLDRAADVTAEARKLEKTGLPKLAELLTSTSRGRAFAEAVEVMNAGRTGRPPREKVDQAIKDYRAFAEEHEEDLRKCLPRASSFSASCYLFAMTLYEHLEMIQNREAWGQAMEEKSQQPKAVQAWMKDAGSSRKFTEALVEAFMAKIKHNKKEKAKKKKAEDSSSDGDAKSSPASAPSPADSPSSSSSSDAKGEKKKQQGKKAKGGKKRLSDSESSASKKKDAKKPKKKPRRASSSGSAEEKKSKKGKKGKAGKAGKAKWTLPSSDSEEEVSMATVVHEWSIGRIQEASAKVATMKTELGDPSSGLTDDGVKEFLAGVPAQALRFGQLTEMAAGVAKKEKLAANQIKAVLSAVESLTNKLLAFHEKQAGGSSAAGSGSAGASAVAAPGDATAAGAGKGAPAAGGSEIAKTTAAQTSEVKDEK